MQRFLAAMKFHGNLQKVTQLQNKWTAVDEWYRGLPES